ncbi:MAG: hypothetical protein EOP22_14895 [Hyphomicrobiales bacterium]|nr:MAG: hypothetical protein EOP22_14895 [Hyphomicrobiales bacterium]
MLTRVRGNPQMDNGRSTIERITFQHAFTLPGFDRAHRPGTFDVRTDREPLDLSWDAYRLTTTILLVDGPELRAVTVRREDLDEALRRDEAEQ